MPHRIQQSLRRSQVAKYYNWTENGGLPDSTASYSCAHKLLNIITEEKMVAYRIQQRSQDAKYYDWRENDGLPDPTVSAALTSC